MKKMKFRKIMGCMIAVMMLVSVIGVTTAQASSMYGLPCIYCGANSTIRTIRPSYTDRKVSSAGCKGEHYYAEKGTQWICTSPTCGKTFREVIETGHYCTNNGGHYCWDDETCDCKG